MLRFLGLALGVSLGVGLFLGGKWYLYVTSGGNPHDVSGAELNALMPEPLNRWGCGRLHARFPETVAPDGCKASGGLDWRS